VGLDDRRIVRRIERARTTPEDVDFGEWPFTLPPVAQLLRDGLELSPGVTFLVGENGSGKSTMVEAIAMAYGLDPEGGTRNTKRSTYVSESPLDRCLHLVRSVGDPKWGFFLRAETMHGWYTHQAELGPSRRRIEWHELSHGESFIAVLKNRFDSEGFYVLDEPEAALSFSGCLGLVALLDAMSEDSQVICATHSPILTALPGATILELDADGYRQVAWADLDLVRHWQTYLDDPDRYLHHLLADDEDDDSVTQ
jgi:predicted ATPase